MSAAHTSTADVGAGAQAASTSAPPCAAPDFAPSTPALRLPPGAWDCHAHVIGPLSRYPLSPQRVYTPPDCIAADYRAMLAAVGVQRAVLVQPSVYGFDNGLLIDTLRGDPHHLRGVAVVPFDVDDADLRRLHDAGVRGARVNLVDRHDRGGGLGLPGLESLAHRVAPMGWHLELLAHVDEHAAELESLGELDVPVVFGHFGYLSIGKGADDPGFAALLRLMQAGRAWVKFTGPYRLTRDGLPYADTDDLAAALREAAPDRIVWGTDWPHVMLKGTMPNDAQLVDLLSRWLPDAALREQVLVRNPAALYDLPLPTVA